MSQRNTEAACIKRDRERATEREREREREMESRVGELPSSIKVTEALTESRPQILVNKLRC